MKVCTKSAAAWTAATQQDGTNAGQSFGLDPILMLSSTKFQTEQPVSYLPELAVPYHPNRTLRCQNTGRLLTTRPLLYLHPGEEGGRRVVTLQSRSLTSIVGDLPKGVVPVHFRQVQPRHQQVLSCFLQNPSTFTHQPKSHFYNNNNNKAKSICLRSSAHQTGKLEQTGSVLVCAN